MFPEFIQNWLLYLSVVRRYSSHTIEAYRLDFIDFSKFLQHHKGEEITLQILESLRVQDFRAWMAFRSQNGLSQRSTARAVSMLRNLYRYLSQKSGKSLAPLTFLKVPRLKIGLPRPLSVSDTQKLIEDMESFVTSQKNAAIWLQLRNKAFFMLLYATGMRISEALSLTRSHISSKDHLIVQGKGKKERVIPLLGVIRDVLEDYFKACPYAGTDDMPLFLGQQGKCLTPTVAQRVLRDYRRYVGLPESVTPHALRHSCATHLLANEGDLRAIQELLGHASLSSTQIYTQVNQEQLLKTFDEAHPRSKKSG